jgi:hypothetical protein
MEAPASLALQPVVSCPSMIQACKLIEAEAMQCGHKIAYLLTHRGRVPDWRHRPLVLDQSCGWKCQPLTGKRADSCDTSHGH